MAVVPELSAMVKGGLVTVEDVRLMQGLAQRVTAVRPDLVNSDATFGELAWIWGKGHASDGGTWPCRLWFSGDTLVAWGWAYLPHEVRRSDGSVQQVTRAYLGYQVHPDQAERAALPNSERRPGPSVRPRLANKNTTRPAGLRGAKGAGHG